MNVNLSDELSNYFPMLKVATMEVKNLENKKLCEELEIEKRKIESEIRKNSKIYLESDIITKYSTFFKKFGNKYPIEYQIKSIAEGKSFPSQYTVVESMFMAELKNMYLTAGHDLDLVEGELNTKIAKGDETYINISDKEMRLKAGDIVTIDGTGIISSVLYGPDRRTRINEKTRNYLFFAYFPYGKKK
ncbi:MAG: B3/4 domain protein [Candidatus Methanofastidiosum methylothiophilum]|uniref:B3/4 domain protein n=1 Tax=Candidatus Methanofastidiosum methylothiophilum TaxID=1705564 RepID=A0A150J1B4_9EURY|nr:MAG: B3/4 domain protein [Candidatus Methanofastidiosum methylthiophilus]KYC46533.1 MAG: B3/4 domain protein [Candidatus Methanofastidiosum methylthiophilus]KYC51009.1 MAG: B3/4 domain protein [Candidatus Methanofastidiosum methylthiophilus]